MKIKKYFKIGMLSLVTVLFFTTNALAKRTIYGNGNVIKETREISSFSELDISHAFDVEVTQSDEESLVIEVDENIMEHIKTEVVAGKLKIFPSRGIKIRKHKTMKAYVSFKALDKISLSGASKMKGMNQMEFDDFTVSASGASKVELNFNTDVVNLRLSGVSKMALKGLANSLMVKASGSSTFNFFDFEVKKCSVKASGSSKINVFVTEKLEVRASGETSVRYKGNPTIEIEGSGNSKVQPYEG